MTYHYSNIEKLLKEAGRDQSLSDIRTYILRLTTDERHILQVMLNRIETEIIDVEYKEMFGDER